MITRQGIRATGKHLLEVLRTERAVAYSRFYSADPATTERLIAGSLPHVEDRETCDENDLEECGHVMLEYAAHQLEELGVVRIAPAPGRLIDGESDFRIELTAGGERALAEGLAFGFRDPDYSIFAHPASEWLVLLLEGGEPGCEVSLEDVMVTGASDGGVVIRDDCGNEYPVGSGSHAWAFEVSLWHHARLKTVGFAGDETQEALWDAFVGRSNRPDRPSPHDDHPLWRVPFRLAAGVDTSRVRHVGRVS